MLEELNGQKNQINLNLEFRSGIDSKLDKRYVNWKEFIISLNI